MNYEIDSLINVFIFRGKTNPFSVIARIDISYPSHNTLYNCDIIDKEDHPLSTNRPDKNLLNEVADLESTPVNSLDAQQKQQARNDRRKQSQHDDKGKYKESYH